MKFLVFNVVVLAALGLLIRGSIPGVGPEPSAASGSGESTAARSAGPSEDDLAQMGVNRGAGAARTEEGAERLDALDRKLERLAAQLEGLGESLDRASRAPAASEGTRDEAPSTSASTRTEPSGTAQRRADNALDRLVEFGAAQRASGEDPGTDAAIDTPPEAPVADMHPSHAPQTTAGLLADAEEPAPVVIEGDLMTPDERRTALLQLAEEMELQFLAAAGD
jgi:hypothetical protein